MRTVARKTAPQRALRHCSKEVVAKVNRRREGGRSVYKTVVKGEFSAIKYLLYKMLSASHQEPMSPRRD